MRRPPASWLLPIIALSVGVAIIVVAVVANRSSQSPAGTPAPVPSGTSTPSAPTEDPKAALPVGVLPAGHRLAYAVPLRDPATMEDNRPLVVTWEDFQCPACRAFEAGPGALLKQAAAAGEMNVVIRPSAFLDARYPGQSSRRAIAAWGCAIDQGRGVDFHSSVFAAQPQEEGVGFSDEQFVQIAADLGIGDLDAFRSCVADGTYLQWADNATAVFYDAGVQRTPTVQANGKELGQEAFADPQSFVSAIEAVPVDPGLALR